MKIQSLQLKNFRCFEDVTIDFHKHLTVLIGVNGSGKTAVIDAIQIFLKEIATQLQDKHEHGYWRKWTLNKDDLRMDGASSDKDEKRTVSMTISLSEPLKKELHWEFSLQRRHDELMEETKSLVIDFSQLCSGIKKNLCRPVFRYFLADRHCGAATISTDTKLATDRDSAYENIAAEHFQNTGSSSWIYNLVARMAFSKVDGTTETYVPEYEAATKAFVRALSPEGVHKPIYEKLGITFDGTNNPYLSVYRVGDKTPYKVSQLSQGYQSMLSLILELAWRMGITNPGMQEDILESPGIVLIDEIELHLHPSWQQTVLPSLMTIFPNTQFIVTTHSPQVLTSIPSECIRILDDGKVYNAPAGSQGAEASRLLKRILGVDARPPLDPVTQKLKAYTKLVDEDKWDSEEAKKLRQDLDGTFKGEDPVLTELDLHIDNRKWELGQ